MSIFNKNILKIQLLILLFYYEYKCSLKNSDKPTLTFQIISVFSENIEKYNKK